MLGIFFKVLEEKKKQKKWPDEVKYGKMWVIVEPGGWEFTSYSVTFLQD